MEISDASQIAIVDKLYTNPGVVTVYKGYIVSDPSREVAVKEMYFSSPQEAGLLINEAYSMQAYSHPNIIRTLGMYLSEDGKSFSIVTDFYSMGDLNKEIKRRQGMRQFWTDEELYCLFRQLISAHAYLQREGVAHRDIKPQNIFLSMENGQIKLTVADLGCATQNHDRSAITIIGTPLYLSPILRQAYVSNQLQHTSNYIHHDIFKSDAYSLGLTMLYMASLQDLNDLTVLNNLQALINARIVRLANLPWAQQIINTMLQVDEETRWDFDQIQRYFFPDDAPPPNQEIKQNPVNQHPNPGNSVSDQHPFQSTSINVETPVFQEVSTDLQVPSNKSEFMNNQGINIMNGGPSSQLNPNNQLNEYYNSDVAQNPNQQPFLGIQSNDSIDSCILCGSYPTVAFQPCSHQYVCKTCMDKDRNQILERIEEIIKIDQISQTCPLCCGYYSE